MDQGSIVVFDEKHNPERSDHQKLPVLEMSNIMVRFMTLQILCPGVSLRAGLFHCVSHCKVCAMSLSSFLHLCLGETQLVQLRKSSMSDAMIDHELLHCSTISQAVRAMGMRWGLRCQESLSQTLSSARGPTWTPI